MLGTVAKAIFGSSNDRYVKQTMKIVAKINALEDEIAALSDEDLKANPDFPQSA
jgi:preprotein translocase subunit SecA